MDRRGDQAEASAISPMILHRKVRRHFAVTDVIAPMCRTEPGDVGQRLLAIDDQMKAVAATEAGECPAAESASAALAPIPAFRRRPGLGASRQEHRIERAGDQGGEVAADEAAVDGVDGACRDGGPAG